MQTERMWLERQGEGKEPQRKEDVPRNLGLQQRQEFSENLQLQSGHDSAQGSVLTEGAGGTSQYLSGTGVRERSGPGISSSRIPAPASWGWRLCRPSSGVDGRGAGPHHSSGTTTP